MVVVCHSNKTHIHTNRTLNHTEQNSRMSRFFFFFFAIGNGAAIQLMKVGFIPPPPPCVYIRLFNHILDAHFSCLVDDWVCPNVLPIVAVIVVAC